MAEQAPNKRLGMVAFAGLLLLSALSRGILEAMPAWGILLVAAVLFGMAVLWARTTEWRAEVRRAQQEAVRRQNGEL